MSLEKINSGSIEKQNNLENETTNLINNYKGKINGILNPHKSQIIQELEDIESKKIGFEYKKETLDALLDKYPNLTIEQFRGYFLSGTYNKNLLSCSAEIIGILNLEEINIGDDLISYVLNKIALSKKEFEEKVVGKIDTLTFPNLSSGDVAQGYFFNKLKEMLKGTNIIFGDMEEIKQNFGVNQFNCDSVGFIDLMGNGLFNTCLLKLIKTPPIEDKLKELNELFGSIKKDIFIGGSTLNIPFNIPESFYGVSMPKNTSNGGRSLNLLKNGTLINSMGYLNSAYYADKVKGSFVLGSHNIAEPMHAGKLTVINNDPKNRYNHNWLISYFGEKTGLLHYMEGTNEENQLEIDNFLKINKEELEKRFINFKNLYETQIMPLIYGVFYNFLRKNFPENIK